MTPDTLVMLRGGLRLPAAPILLMLDLERRGIVVEVDGDDLVVGPRDRLTGDEGAALRRWKRHVSAIVRYCSQVVM